MPIHEGNDQGEHDNAAHADFAEAIGSAHTYGELDVIDQTWTTRDGERDEAWVDHIPTKPAAGAQDLPGGHQAAMVTLTLIQPAAGAQLFGSAVYQALPKDPGRLECRILPIDGPVMIATSREAAEAGYGQGLGASTIVGGPWAWCPSGIERAIRSGDAIYVALPGSAAATTHVSVIAARRLE